MSPEARFLPVDRRNAFTWFSRGLVLPPESMTKYRPDALAGSPSALPLAAAAHVGHLARSAEFPVALEISPAVSWEESVGEPNAPVLLLHGALSTKRIVRVHVASAVDAEQVSVRAYRGFDAGELRVEVTPSLFEVSPGPATVSEADDASTSDMDSSLLLRREAVAGALLGTADPDLNNAFRRDASPDPLPDLVEVLRATGYLAEPNDAELLLGVLEAVLGEKSLGDLIPTQLVARLSTSPLAAGIPGLHAYLDRILQLIRGEDELRPFKPGGLLVAKALLLFLLRPDPETVRSWDAEQELGAEREVLMLSRLMAGFASTYAGLPSALREGTSEIPLLDWVAAGVQPNDFIVNPKPLPEPDSGGVSAASSADGPGSIRSVLLQELDAGKLDRPVAVARAMGWSDTLILHVTAGSIEVRNHGRRVRASFAPGAVPEWGLVAERFRDLLEGTDEAAILGALEGRKPRKRSTRKPRSKEAEPAAAST